MHVFVLFQVLQEVSALLPDDERVQMLDAIQKLSKETRRVAASRRARASCLHPNNDATITDRPLRSVNKQSYNTDSKLPQIFRPKEEFQPHTLEATKQAEKERSVRALKQQENIAQRERELTKEIDKIKSEHTLLGTCRAVRWQHGTTRHSFLGGASTCNGSLFLDSVPSLPLLRETSLTGHSSPFGISSYEGIRNSNVALLQLTEDKQLRLTKPSNESIHPIVYADKPLGKKRDVVTKL
jgi:hypothetical protein